jgi:hypothetical protein
MKSITLSDQELELLVKVLDATMFASSFHADGSETLSGKDVELNDAQCALGIELLHKLDPEYAGDDDPFMNF